MRSGSTWPNKHRYITLLICHSCAHHLMFVPNRAIGNWKVLIVTVANCCYSVAKFLAAHTSDSTGENLHFAHYTENMDFIPKERLSWMLKLRSWTLGWEDFCHQVWLASSSVWEQNYVWMVGWEREAENHKSNFSFSFLLYKELLERLTVN